MNDYITAIVELFKMVANTPTQKVVVLFIGVVLSILAWKSPEIIKEVKQPVSYTVVQPKK